MVSDNWPSVMEFVRPLASLSAGSSRHATVAPTSWRNSFTIDRAARPPLRRSNRRQRGLGSIMVTNRAMECRLFSSRPRSRSASQLAGSAEMVGAARTIRIVWKMFPFRPAPATRRAPQSEK